MERKLVLGLVLLLGKYVISANYFFDTIDSAYLRVLGLSE